MKSAIYGPLGAGKNVQCKKLERRYGIPHVVTGQILRENAEMETPHGTPKEYMEEGKYVPDEMINSIVEAEISDREHFILDGYPRTMEQVENFSDIADLDVVIHFELSDETTFYRLLDRRICSECGDSFHPEYRPPDTPGECTFCGGELVERDDDREEIIRQRIREYKEKTVPVIEHYSDDVVTVDAERPHEVVWEDFFDVVREYVPAAE